MKIIVTRGIGGHGYRQPENIEPTRILSLYPYPNYPNQFKTIWYCSRFCHTRLGLNPSLAGLKHLNRLEQVLARSEWHNPEIQEGLMLDSIGRVIEGTMSNLFFIKDRTLITSPLFYSGIPALCVSVSCIWRAPMIFRLRSSILCKKICWQQTKYSSPIPLSGFGLLGNYNKKYLWSVNMANLYGLVGAIFVKTHLKVTLGVLGLVCVSAAIWGWMAFQQALDKPLTPQDKLLVEFQRVRLLIKSLPVCSSNSWILVPFGLKRSLIAITWRGN